MDPEYDYLVTVLTDKFDVLPESINPKATLTELDLDSLAVVELYLTLQEHWDIPLDDSNAAGDLTLDDVTRAVRDLRAQATPGT